VVLTDSKNSTKSGRFLELLGSYDPRKTTEVFNGERIKEWMGKGAKLSDTLHNLLVSHKIIDGKKINVLPKKSPPPNEPAAVQDSLSRTGQADEVVTPAVEVSVSDSTEVKEVKEAPKAEEPAVAEVKKEEAISMPEVVVEAETNPASVSEEPKAEESAS
jgi:small subunit ribosomal protein S16